MKIRVLKYNHHIYPSFTTPDKMLNFVKFVWPGEGTLYDPMTNTILSTDEWIIEDTTQEYSRAFHWTLIDVLEVEDGEFKNEHFRKYSNSNRYYRQ